MIDEEKILLLNLYIDQIPPGTHTIAKVKIRYDDPASGQKGLETATFSLDITSQALYQSQLDEQVQKSILTLAKYRQTQIAEEKLKQGDRAAAATMLQTAAKPLYNWEKKTPPLSSKLMPPVYRWEKN